MSPPQVTLSVLNYDGRELLDRYLPSVIAQRAEGVEVEVVVIDNGSHDGSVEHVRATWPGVRVVAFAENVGVTAAMNAQFAAGDGEWVAVLNNDVELAPDWLALLLATLRAHPEAAAAAGKLLSDGDRGVIDRTGDEVLWSSLAQGRGAGERDAGQWEQPGEVFGVGGSAALYRRAAVEAVGPLDEQFFAYLEDVDWGFRARLAGFTARYEPRALGWHLGGATLGQVNPFSLYHLRRNQLWLVAKNYPLASLVRHGPRVASYNLHAVAMAARRGHLPLLGRAYRDAVRGMPAIVRKRRAIQRARAIGPRELEELLR